MKKRHTVEQIAAMFRKAEVDLAKEKKAPEVAAKKGQHATLARWYSKPPGPGKESEM